MAAKKATKARKTVSITCEVTEAAHKKLSKIAKETKSSVGAIASKAISSGLKHSKETKVVKIKW